MAGTVTCKLPRLTRYLTAYVFKYGGLSCQRVHRSSGTANLILPKQSDDKTTFVPIELRNYSTNVADHQKWH